MPIDSSLFVYNMHLPIIGSLRNDEDDGNENSKKAIGLDKQNKNFARAPEGDSHMKQTGMLVGNFGFNP